MKQPWVYMCSPSQSPLPPPSLPDPSRSSWRRLLKVSFTAKRSNQSILKEINSEYSMEGLMLKLKLQYFGHLMRRADSLEKTLILGKTEGRRRRE